MSKEFKESFRQNIRIIVLSIIIGSSFSYVGAIWSPPSNSPTSGWNADAPINISGTYQAKGVGGVISSPSLRATNLLIGGYASGGIPSTIENSSEIRIATDGNVAAKEYCNADGTDCKSYAELTSGGIPPGAIMAFNLYGCPAGWTLANSTNRVSGDDKNPLDLSRRNIIGVGGTTGAYAFRKTGGKVSDYIAFKHLPSYDFVNSISTQSSGRDDGGNSAVTKVRENAKRGSAELFPVMDPYVALTYCVKD